MAVNGIDPRRNELLVVKITANQRKGVMIWLRSQVFGFKIIVL